MHALVPKIHLLHCSLDNLDAGLNQYVLVVALDWAELEIHCCSGSHLSFQIDDGYLPLAEYAHECRILIDKHPGGEPHFTAKSG